MTVQHHPHASASRAFEDLLPLRRQPYGLLSRILGWFGL